MNINKLIETDTPTTTKRPLDADAPDAKRRKCGSESVLLDANKSRARLVRGMLTADECAELLQAFSATAPFWCQETVTMFGKEFRTKRRVATFGAPGATYVYAKRSTTADGWGPLRALKAKLERAFDLRVNFCHCNRYEDGTVALSWHADDEQCIVEDSTIVSVSLGETRDFQIRAKAETRGTLTTVALGHGDVLLMEGEMQKHYKHCVPQRKRARAARVNLTFRLVK